MTQPPTNAAPISTALNISPDDLRASPPAANWPSYNGDYSGRRFSSLTQITPANVAQLRAEWAFHVQASSDLEVTPIAIDGILFISAANDVYAVDARAGRALWHFSRPVSEGLIDDASQHHSRGVAVWHSRVFLLTDNAHLLCLDARSGHLLWDVPYTNGNKNYGATSAPLVVHDKVLVGTSGGDDGVRGFVAAYNAETGKQEWRFWTIPAPGEPGSESWPGKAYLSGGGTTWMPGTYDPDLNTLYWGTSNPSPDFDGSVRPGDDLYTDCVLALDPDTGKLKWHFQFTPHDLFDYDATETAVLVDTTYQGEPRKLLVEANRNGFVYVLDRITGKFLSATRFAEKMNWATGIDPTGRPIRTSVAPSPDGTLVCPGFEGATNWYAPSYNPATHLLYFLSLEDCATYFLKPQEFEEGRTYYSTGMQGVGETGKEYINAFDLRTLDFAWHDLQIGMNKGWGGVMSTATGLVAHGDNAENFVILNGYTGKPLWHFNVGQLIRASPMSYAINGKQYFAIAAGSDVFPLRCPSI